jgi:protease-4
MTESEKEMIQAEINMIYSTFKQRVAEGRKLDTAYVETIAQGRVWTGIRAKEIGLIDRFGGIQDAIRAAASLAKLKEYRVREFPEPENILEAIFSSEPPEVTEKIRQELGEENYSIFMEMKRIREMCNKPQARLPFDFQVR